MKKKIAVLLSLLLVMFVFTGCMRFDTNLTINEDGTANVSMLVAVSDLVSESMGSDAEIFTEEDLADMQDEGWTVSKYDEEEYTGVKIEKSGIKLDDLTGDSGSSDMDEIIDSATLSKDGNKYTLQMDVFSEDESEQISEYADYFNYAGGYMRFTVTLPEAALENNATEVSEDGLTYTWNFLEMSSDDKVSITFELPGLSSSLLYVLIGVIAVIIIVALLLISRKKKSSAAVSEAAAEYGYVPVIAETGEVSENVIDAKDITEASDSVEVPSEVPAEVLAEVPAEVSGIAEITAEETADDTDETVEETSEFSAEETVSENKDA